MKRALVSVIGVALMSFVSSAHAETSTFCAAPNQAEAIQAKYKSLPGSRPSNIGAALNLPEATVLSGLPVDQSIAVKSTELPLVWKSLSKWTNALTLISRDGHDFQVNGPVHAGELDDQGKFHLTNVGWGAAGHINSREIGGIFALSLPTHSDVRINGVLFTNLEGALSFAVMVPTVNGKPSKTVTSDYYETMALMRTLPKLCS